MGNKKISELNILDSRPGDSDLFPIVHEGETMAVSYGNLIRSGDGLFTGFPVRTIYSRSNVVSYTAGSSAVDLMLGDIGSTFGSRLVSGDFFSGQFLSKVIYLKTFGKFTSNTGSVTISIMIGDDIISSSNIGAVVLSQPQDHPFEIFGELVFNGSGVTACYSIGHCANNGDFKRYPLSDPTIIQDVTGFVGGDIGLMFSSSTLGVTTYGGYIQVLS